MKKRLLVWLLSATLFVFNSAILSAENEKHEISGGTSSALFFFDEEVFFAAGAGYEYMLSRNLFIGLDASIRQVDDDEFDYSVLAGPTLNLGETFYLAPRLGLEFIDAVDNDAYFKYAVNIGARVRLGHNSIFFKPYVQLGNYEEDIGFLFVPASFSFRF